MELFQGLSSADAILFATLTTRPKTQTSEEAPEADVLPFNYASDGKVVEFQNTAEAAQDMFHLSLKKTLSVGVGVSMVDTPRLRIGCLVVFGKGFEKFITKNGESS